MKFNERSNGSIRAYGGDRPFEEPQPLVYRNGNSIYFYDEMDRNSLIILKKLCLDIKSERYDLIHLIIASEGGYPYSIYEFLKGLGIPVYTYIDGFCCSAATIMYLAGTKRYIAPTAFFLIHSARTVYSEAKEWKAGSLSDELENIMMDNEIALKPIYKMETKIPEKELNEMLKDREKFLTAKECIKWKIAHEIGVFIGGF